MDEKYEVTVSVGVRQVDRAGNPGFQASDTFVVPITGFSGLAELLGNIHGMTKDLAAAAGPQDRRR